MVAQRWSPTASTQQPTEDVNNAELAVIRKASGNLIFRSMQKDDEITSFLEKLNSPFMALNGQKHTKVTVATVVHFKASSLRTIRILSIW